MVLKVGNNGNNALYGLAGDDILKGLGGNDTLFGGAGNDEMYGGIGNDAYYVTEAGDDVYEQANEGFDTVHTTVDGYTLTAHVEALVMADIAGAITGFGNNLNNALTGNASANTLYGWAGNDIINGGLGADEMLGGVGDDTYFVENFNDGVVETQDAGQDTVYTSVGYSLLFRPHVENITLLPVAGAAWAEGNDLANTLIGNASANSLIGHDGSDVLDGGLGNDIMTGGNQSDTYYVRDSGDLVIEDPFEGGWDSVHTAVNYELTDNVEDLYLTLTNAPIDGTGNDLDNWIWGNDAANVIEGLDGVDTLIGAGGNDTLYGGGGRDYLAGGTGADDMYGGVGDDDFEVDDAGDEVHGGPGQDMVWTFIDYALPLEAEDLMMADLTAFNGTGNAFANRIWGNDNNNILSGGGGGDMLHSGEGDDTLDGGSGNDTLCGGLNLDTMSGGADADTFVWALHHRDRAHRRRPPT